MPELRKDPVVGRWVIIATERARRPSDFVAQPVRPVGTECVFCAGNEHKTPPEILAGRSPGSRPNEPGWSYRVRSEEHTSELQSHHDLVCRLLLEKKKENRTQG